MVKEAVKAKSTGTGSGTEDGSIGMIHNNNNNKQHDVMAALTGWERRNKIKTPSLLAPAASAHFRLKVHLHQHQSLIFYTPERSQP